MRFFIPNFKKSLFILLVITCALTHFVSFAQVNIASANINKIIIRDGYGNLNGKGHTDYEVKLENNKWTSTQIERYSNSLDSKFDSTTNMHERKFVTCVNRLYVDRLLFALNHPVKTLQLQVLGITPRYLIDNADSLYKRPSAFGPGQMAEFKKHITQQNINKGILQSTTTNWTDVASYCTIKIIGKTGDTTNIVSKMHSDFMFPWVVNKKQSVYNVAISKFCAAAVNNRYSNKYLLGGKSANEAVYDYVYNTYIKKPAKQ